MTRTILLAALPLLLAAAGPCSDSKTGGSPPADISAEGTIHRGVGPECPDTWHIATTDGRVLWPVNDPAFQQEGLRVRFTAKERPDMSSICMAGTIVDVLTIEKL